MSDYLKKLKQNGEVLRPVLWELTPGALFGFITCFLFSFTLFIPIVLVGVYASASVAFFFAFLIIFMFHLLGVTVAAVHMVSEWSYRGKSAYCERVTSGRASNINPVFLYICIGVFGWCYAGHAIMNPMFVNQEKREPPVTPAYPMIPNEPV